jgi:plasmid stabilization system protein ParE
MQVKILGSAKSDFKDIRALLINYGTTPANNFRNAYKKFITHVKKMPEMHPVYEFNPDYRVAVLIYDYVAFYKVTENTIVVYRVLHSRRNSAAILRDT